MKVEDVCKIVPCSAGCTEGRVMRYPHYSIPMPEVVEENCQTCRGLGKVVLVASGLVTVRDSSFKVAGF